MHKGGLMADMTAVTVAINGVNNLSGPVGGAIGSLDALEGTTHKTIGAVIGLAAAIAGVEERAIMAQTRHRSVAVARRRGVNNC